MWTDPTWTEPNEHRPIVPRASGPLGAAPVRISVTRHWGRYELLGPMQYGAFPALGAHLASDAQIEPEA